MRASLIGMSVVLSVWPLAAGCDVQSPHEPDPQGGGVAAARASVRRIAATGRVEGWREADVVSKLPGRILRFEYNEGDDVEAGAAVVRLEDGDLRARVRVAAARTREAARALRRTTALRAKAIVSASEFDAAEAAYLSDAAALDEAKAVLEYATIKAPFRGTVLRKFKEVGEGATTNGGPDPLFRIGDLSRLKVTAEVPERDIAALRVGQFAEVRTEAYPDDAFGATVSRVGLAIGRKNLRSDDPRARLDEKVLEVELSLAADARLKSGMTVDVVFQVPQ
jgi:HlyD family secretion protein